MHANEKVDIVFSTLASSNSVYRVWWWSNYTSIDKQSSLRTEWIKYLSRYSTQEIRQGLKNWQIKYGNHRPPVAKEFSEFIKPKHTQQSKQSLTHIKELLNNNKYISKN